MMVITSGLSSKWVFQTITIPSGSFNDIGFLLYDAHISSSYYINMCLVINTTKREKWLTFEFQANPVIVLFLLHFAS